VFAGVEMAKNPNETAKKPDETAKKSRSQNVKTETETAKKNWKWRYFRQPATIIAVSDFER
jgi:hypothetical protein